MKKNYFIAKNTSKFKINYYFIIIIIVIVNSVILLNWFSNKITSKIMEIAKVKTNEEIYSIINNNVGKSLRRLDLNNLLKITKNKNDEIVLAEYDLDTIYNILNEITIVLEKDNTMHSKGLILNIPIGMASKHLILNNLGPRIPVKSVIVGNILTNIKTKMTNYGLNNVLAEVYVTLEINEQVIIPMTYTKLNTKYDILISTFFINGKVPSFYGNNYEATSKVYDVNLTN